MIQLGEFHWLMSLFPWFGKVDITSTGHFNLKLAFWNLINPNIVFKISQPWLFNFRIFLNTSNWVIFFPFFFLIYFVTRQRRDASRKTSLPSSPSWRLFSISAKNESKTRKVSFKTKNDRFVHTYCHNVQDFQGKIRKHRHINQIYWLTNLEVFSPKIVFFFSRNLGLFCWKIEARPCADDVFSIVWKQFCQWNFKYFIFMTIKTASFLST